MEDQIRAATEQVSEFQAHFTVVPGSIFCSLGSLPRYESLSGEQSLSYQTAWRVRRAQNRGEVFVFLSHQWFYSVEITFRCYAFHIGSATRPTRKVYIILQW